MKPQQQRIAIAEACGWTKIYFDNDQALIGHNHTGWARLLPDHLNDLNAMHAALKAQTQAFRAEFDRLLHVMAEEKHLLVTELEAKDWADCFISCLQSQREGNGNPN
jgi:hypothetical protein